MTESQDQSPERPSSGIFDLDRLRALIELMQQHDIAEVDLREGGQRIRVSRGSVVQPVPFEPVRVASASAPAGSASSPAATPPPATESPNIVEIKSPMVGTFYSRPNPNAEPFVKVGDHVEPETTVCIIEAMKMFNEIPAEVRGKIVAVLVSDEEPVDYGRPLFKVDTSG
ncbi:MAG: acetyl-CoA carboxylase, biotin carboxyl carrier protein [Pirellulaceae bacterium]|nr:MAG: acetyl-CoA carboxylase, biotin carboxyl carrier protein [Pirellulaceae bacterium]